MEFKTILIETKNDFKEEKHNMSINLSDPYFAVMEKHYKEINEYIKTKINGKRGEERGKLLGDMNLLLKSVIENKDLMMFILEHLSEEYNFIDKF